MNVSTSRYRGNNEKSRCCLLPMTFNDKDSNSQPQVSGEQVLKIQKGILGPDSRFFLQLLNSDMIAVNPF